MRNKCYIIVAKIEATIILCIPSISYASETDGPFGHQLHGDEAIVTGMRSMTGNSAYISSQVTFNNLHYNVVEIDDYAFSK